MANQRHKMTVLHCGLFFMFMFIEQSAQFSISSEVNSEPSNQTGCLKTIGQCLRVRPNELASCAIEHALNNMDCVIASNATWHLNEFISLKKNDDWQPTEIEAREHQSVPETLFSKLSDLIASRSIQFAMPRDSEGRIHTGFDFGGLTNDLGSGRGKKHGKHKHGMMGTLTVIAMMAQLFLGKIAFLAGAALLLSKISLIFSIVNALKKQNTVHTTGGEHWVDPGHGYQRSLMQYQHPTTNWPTTDWPTTDWPPMDWSSTEMPLNTYAPIPT